MPVKTSILKPHQHLTDETLLSLYKNLITSRLMDDKMLIMLKQGKSFFHIGASGHEAIQTAMAYALQPGDAVMVFCTQAPGIWMPTTNAIGP